MRSLIMAFALVIAMPSMAARLTPVEKAEKALEKAVKRVEKAKERAAERYEAALIRALEAQEKLKEAKEDLDRSK